jgi:hypothetical protein
MPTTGYSLPPNTALIQRLAGLVRLHNLVADVPQPERGHALATLQQREVQACFGGGRWSTSPSSSRT